jgi:hypothetical protein
MVNGSNGAFVGTWKGGACAAIGNPWAVRVAFGQVFILDGDNNRLTRWLLPTLTSPNDCILLQSLSVRGDGAHQMGVDASTHAIYVASVKTPSYVTRFVPIS